MRCTDGSCFPPPKPPDPSPCGDAGAPDFLANGAGMNHAPDLIGATAQLYSFSIPIKYCKGVVRLNGFIQRAAVAPPPFGILSMGDNRGFDSRSTGRESRASVELDFQRGLGRLFVNYTCHPKTVGDLDPACYSADPIGVGNVDVSGAENSSGFNEFSHKVNGDSLELAWNLVESTSRMFGIAPCGIVGKMTVDISGDDSGIDIRDFVTRDFPSFEVYQYRNGQATSLAEPRSEHDLTDLCARR